MEERLAEVAGGGGEELRAAAGACTGSCWRRRGRPAEEREMSERERERNRRRRRLRLETSLTKDAGVGRWIGFGQVASLLGLSMDWTGCLLGLSISLNQPFYLSEPTIQLFIFFF